MEGGMRDRGGIDGGEADEGGATEVGGPRCDDDTGASGGTERGGGPRAMFEVYPLCD
jgi:hypothetical protein